jgi:dTMP kinase
MNAVGLKSASHLISLEGGEGAGKSTVLSALASVLNETGVSVVCTREPGGSPLAEDIRQLLLNRTEDGPTADTELLLMFASRAQHVQRVIAPALAAGAWVLSDRFTDASYAYQGAARGIDTDIIAQLERRFVGIVPGLTLLLDVPVDVGRARASGRGAPDRIEREKDIFFEHVRAAYRTRAEADPQRFRVIDATQSPGDVADEAVRHLRAYMKDHA